MNGFPWRSTHPEVKRLIITTNANLLNALLVRSAIDVSGKGRSLQGRSLNR
ncbi:hypothetical protein H6F76_09195 [Leptolyngbya sp. FACHB-321]|uniref:hypothetical protein n=1 Tax=Leptolyngbya sp. FACHB-321 TaxID=2692807 RepID=UPI0016862B89|nr:hypothetical protein [Leptolyngbya sp. FACHB-321]MBD2035202.1 hypothetical protein [Leptolyngbya sp. FACHB-321]